MTKMMLFRVTFGFLVLQASGPPARPPARSLYLLLYIYFLMGNLEIGGGRLDSPKNPKVTKVRVFFFIINHLTVTEVTKSDQNRLLFQWLRSV